MLKKMAVLFLSSMNLFIFANVEAAPVSNQAPSYNQSQSSAQSQAKNSNFQRKLEIMEDDQREGTDIFAIPLDESDIEDQIQINQDERRNLNDLNLPKVPDSRSNRR